MNFSLLPLLFATQMLAIYYVARRAVQQGKMASTGWVKFLVLVLIVWGAASTWLGLSGFYESKPFLAAYPILWLPFIPVVLVMTFLILFGSARDAVRGLIDATPITWLVGIHTLRILAIGTLIKAYKGEFSVSFATYVGIPDLLFGLSAVLMLWLAAKDRIGSFAFMMWNLLGVLVILPGAAIVAQMELPGRFFRYEASPSIVTLFEFPMVLGPSLVVPIFIMMNLLVVFRLVEKMIIAGKLRARIRA